MIESMSDIWYLVAGGAAWGFLNAAWRTVHELLTRRNAPAAVPCMLHDTLEKRLDRIEAKLDRVLEAP